MVNLGITPEYFLDKMSLDEVIALTKASDRRLYEKERLQCFFNLIAQGAKVKKPTDVMLFEWEKKTKKEVKRLTKEELNKKAEDGKRLLNRL